ncbi:MAG TPA: HPr family phosphocarrier protein [Candidatus Faecousia excrementipullorum]|jgi:phosphocarrier protein|uniref:HPr family phosphocarrier protein n=1 Tax=Candidatus Faecousia excrementigallinarum TaxID=2840806 RepID=A0A9D0Z3V9_9FIRM|nr:HPr family phosphocarrier protein [Candidatus Faecousia excrementigallinarum]HIQ76413.1 HPr family phosphocarrier protein [Candidatus Faecousia excrementipullorum]
MKEFTHVIADPLGLHARPAGLLVKAAAAYQSTVTVTAPTGKADAKRIMAVMRLAAKQGMELTVTCEGPDEEAAAAGLQAFLKENL